MFYIIKLTLTAALLLTLTGCSVSSLMFYPLKQYPATPAQLGLEYSEVHHKARDGIKLVSWWLPAKLAEGIQPKGSVLFLHGNAQNISYHQFNTNWLTNHGYNVFMLGYRQFGDSDGLARLPDIFLDVHAGLDWMFVHHGELPVVVLGQSMGAALSVYGVASYQGEQVSAIILDAVFDSFPNMAATAMSRNWFTWPLQTVAWSMTERYDPINWVKRLPAVPLLVMHSEEDSVVPYQMGRTIYLSADSPKRWIDNKGGHIKTFRHKDLRTEVLEFLSANLSSTN
jgi:hypothetical protein